MAALLSPAHWITRRGQSGVHAALADRRRYERQIDRLHQHHLFDGGLHRLTDGEISLATVVMHRGEVARLLAHTVAEGGYQLRAATVRSIVVDGRRRTVYGYPLLDLIVHGVVAEVLGEAIEPRLSSSVYSYRSGQSWLNGVSGLARYLRRHRRERPDPRTRGLFVLRRDVDAYTDSIPLGTGSAIWSQLQQAVDSLGAPVPTAADQRLIEDVVRPTFLVDGASPATRLHGVATGQPISCVCFNLYLGDVDRALADIAGGFYARYSDDLVFAHPDPVVARAASDLLDRQVAALGLRFNADKQRDLYLTGAGRSSVDWPEARGTTSVAFLGMLVHADGTIALGRRKTRGLLRDARRRAANTGRALSHLDGDARGRAVAQTLNTLLDRNDHQLHGAAAPLLAGAVTDRRQLDQFDHQLARLVASAATGVNGPAAFRRVPYRRVRGELGLRSLRRARDNGARTGR